MSFKSENNFDKRKSETDKIRKKFPDRIPVIVEKVDKSDIPAIDKKKFLVPSNISIGQFLFIIRKRIKLQAEKAIFVFINGKIPKTSETIEKVYTEHKDEDGFLYVNYAGENTFGSF